jgi:hypothetical protein
MSTTTRLRIVVGKLMTERVFQCNDSERIFHKPIIKRASSCWKAGSTVACQHPYIHSWSLAHRHGMKAPALSQSVFLLPPRRKEDKWQHCRVPSFPFFLSFLLLPRHSLPVLSMSIPRSLSSVLSIFLLALGTVVDARKINVPRPNPFVDPRHDPYNPLKYIASNTLTAIAVGGHYFLGHVNPLEFH